MCGLKPQYSSPLFIENTSENVQYFSAEEKQTLEKPIRGGSWSWHNANQDVRALMKNSMKATTINGISAVAIVQPENVRLFVWLRPHN